jgi:hypothetical protein
MATCKSYNWSFSSPLWQPQHETAGAPHLQVPRPSIWRVVPWVPSPAVVAGVSLVPLMILQRFHTPRGPEAHLVLDGHSLICIEIPRCALLSFPPGKRRAGRKGAMLRWFKFLGDLDRSWLLGQCYQCCGMLWVSLTWMCIPVGIPNLQPVSSFNNGL